jgi:hypothetical protein
MVVGDSTAKADAAGLIQWGTDTGEALVSDAGTQPGCGLVRRGRRMFGTKPEAVPSFCQNWPQQWTNALTANPADAAVLLDAPWDTTNHQLPGSNAWVGFGDPAYDTEFAQELATGVDTLLKKVPTVVLVTSPYIQTGWGVTEAVANDPINDHARMDRLNALLREIAGQRPGVVVVDLAGHLIADPSKPLTNADLRPDGVHFTPEAARDVADWLGPAIVTAVRGA